MIKFNQIKVFVTDFVKLILIFILAFAGVSIIIQNGEFNQQLTNNLRHSFIYRAGIIVCTIKLVIAFSSVVKRGVFVLVDYISQGVCQSQYIFVSCEPCKYNWFAKWNKNYLGINYIVKVKKAKKEHLLVMTTFCDLNKGDKCLFKTTRLSKIVLNYKRV